MNPDDLLLDIILLIEEYPSFEAVLEQNEEYEDAKAYLIKKKMYD